MAAIAEMHEQNFEYRQFADLYRPVEWRCATRHASGSAEVVMSQDLPHVRERECAGRRNRDEY